MKKPLFIFDDDDSTLDVHFETRELWGYYEPPEIEAGLYTGFDAEGVPFVLVCADDGRVFPSLREQREPAPDEFKARLIQTLTILYELRGSRRDLARIPQMSLEELKALAIEWSSCPRADAKQGIDIINSIADVLVGEYVERWARDSLRLWHLRRPLFAWWGKRRRRFEQTRQEVLERLLSSFFPLFLVCETKIDAPTLEAHLIRVEERHWQVESTVSPTDLIDSLCGGNFWLYLRGQPLARVALEEARWEEPKTFLQAVSTLDCPALVHGLVDDVEWYVCADMSRDITLASP